MKILALATLVLTAVASPGFAKERPATPVREAANTVSSGSRATVVIGRDGQDTRQRCSTDNPNIEYRDCVNASTRDPNAKVRLG